MHRSNDTSLSPAGGGWLHEKKRIHDRGWIEADRLLYSSLKLLAGKEQASGFRKLNLFVHPHLKDFSIRKASPAGGGYDAASNPGGV